MDTPSYYLYAGLDFMLDQNLNLVFLEANAVPGGIYVMDRANSIIIEEKPQLREKLGTINIVSTFVERCIKFYSSRYGSLNVVAITTPLVGGLSLMPERTEIMLNFLRRGIDAFIVNRKKYFVRENNFYINIGNRSLRPDLIIRRNTDFPKNLKQPVINPSEVGFVTGSKIRTYNAIKNLDHFNLFRIPKTFYARKKKNIISYAEALLAEGHEVIIKPNKGEKGKNIFLVRDSNDLTKVITNLKDNTSYIIQERIIPFYLHREDGLYVFDIRAYIFMGKFISAHIRRAKNPVHHGPWFAWGISNVSLGGRYVPIIVDNFVGTTRWARTQKQVKPFKSIIVDKYAFVMDNELYRRLALASELIVKAIDHKVVELLANRIGEKY